MSAASPTNDPLTTPRTRRLSFSRWCEPNHYNPDGIGPVRLPACANSTRHCFPHSEKHVTSPGYRGGLEARIRREQKAVESGGCPSERAVRRSASLVANSSDQTSGTEDVNARSFRGCFAFGDDSHAAMVTVYASLSLVRCLFILFACLMNPTSTLCVRAAIAPFARFSAMI